MAVCKLAAIHTKEKAFSNLFTCRQVEKGSYAVDGQKIRCIIAHIKAIELQCTSYHCIIHHHTPAMNKNTGNSVNFSKVANSSVAHRVSMVIA
jgi:hypothetical protein